MTAGADRWARWVLRPENELDSMHPVRDRVLANAGVRAGNVEHCRRAATDQGIDERDLLAHAERAGFAEIRLALEVRITSNPWVSGPREAFLRTAGNPCVPPLEDVVDRALTAEEKTRFCAHRRPLVERGEGERRMALAYLWAVKAP